MIRSPFDDWFARIDDGCEPTNPPGVSPFVERESMHFAVRPADNFGLPPLFASHAIINNKRAV